jgi:uncharacterized SAM-binding protein YcdF (DUF218 family)
MRGEMRFRRFVVLLLIFVALASQAARLLVVNNPQKSDAMVVLAGDTNVRPAHALALLRQGMAPHLYLDVVVRDQIFDQRLSDLAQKYAASLPEASQISVCPITGLSTNAETNDVNRCLQSAEVRTVLIVTSEFHTRRSLSIFRHRLPQYEFSVAAARDPTQFGNAWWTNREWAKITLEEWMKLLWWEAVDRWRK